MKSLEMFVSELRKAGAGMTQEQISAIGNEAAEKFGIDKDMLMLALLSGTEQFKEYALR